MFNSFAYFTVILIQWGEMYEIFKKEYRDASHVWS